MELLLIFPAAIFMAALFVRNLEPLQYEPARTAALIVAWYAARPHLGLWVLLTALPFTALVLGCGTLARGWNTDAELRQAIREHLSILLIAAATLASATMLAIVALHVATN